MRAATACLVIGLQGCAALSGETYYKEPDTSQLARVRFVGSGTSHDGILVTQHESSTCELGNRGGIMGVVGGVHTTPVPLAGAPAHVREVGNTQLIVGYGADSGPAPVERVIAADRPFVFTIRRNVESWASVGRHTRWICTFTREFTPRAGEQYEVVYYDSAYSEKAGRPLCGARVNRLQVGSNGAVQRQREASFRDAPQTCAPAAGR